MNKFKIFYEIKFLWGGGEVEMGWWGEKLGGMG